MIYRMRRGDTFTAELTEMDTDGHWRANCQLKEDFSTRLRAWIKAGKNPATKPRLAQWESEAHRKAFIVTLNNDDVIEVDAMGSSDAMARAASIVAERRGVDVVGMGDRALASYMAKFGVNKCKATVKRNLDGLTSATA